mgnify:CR=1 FL=1
MHSLEASSYTTPNCPGAIPCNFSSETIRQLVEERHRQKMTQQEIADITGIKPSNMARFESGGRVPTLVVLEKYANALGKHIEIKICDG